MIDKIKLLIDKHNALKITNYNFKWIICAILVLSGIVLLFLGFFSIPVGEIHNSVVSVFGMILTFAGGIVGIDYKYLSKNANTISAEQIEDIINRILEKTSKNS